MLGFTDETVRLDNVIDSSDKLRNNSDTGMQQGNIGKI
jgi:hypothetical protein